MPRIGLVVEVDPADQAVWSGVPASLTSGLEAAGCTVVPIRATFPKSRLIARLLRMSWADQATSRWFATCCGAVASRRVRRAGPLDGIVALGSGYRLSTQVPFTTFEDMGLALALRHGMAPYGSLRPRRAAVWLTRQRHIYSDARGCCVASTWAANSIDRDYGIPPSKVHVVGVGHNIDVGLAARDWSRPRFLFVGADWVRKRGDAVVSAFAEVRRRHPEATLDLVGSHPPVEAEGVTGHGPLPLSSEDGQRRYGELLHRATCFLMPSAYEPFGIAYVDAGAAGVASIGTTVGGAPDAVGDGGLVVDPADGRALVAAMLELCDPETARELGARAHRRSALLTWRAVGERLLRALRPPGVALDSLAPFLDRIPQPAEAC